VIAVRGAAGVLITASAPSPSNDMILNRDALLGAANFGESVESYLSDMASKLADDSAADGGGKELVESMENCQPNRGRAVTAISGNDGVMVASPKAIALAAQHGIHANCSHDLHLGTGGSLLSRAARGISMLACKLGIKLIAGGGDVQVR